MPSEDVSTKNDSPFISSKDARRLLAKDNLWSAYREHPNPDDYLFPRFSGFWLNTPKGCRDE